MQKITVPILLYSYILTETIIPFLASLLILGNILFLGKLLPLFDLIINFRVNPLDFLKLCIYLTPNLLLYAIPMASMLGVILCFSRMVADNEIIALKSVGIGTNNLLPPITVFAVVTAALTLYIGTGLIPTSTIATEKLLFKIATEKFDKGLKENQFGQGIGKVVFYIDRIKPDSHKWQGIYLSDTRDSRNPMIITAARGQFTAKPEQLLLQVTLKDGSIHRTIQEEPGKELSETIQFEKYSLNLPLRYPQFLDSDKSVAFGKKAMTQKELLAFAEKHEPGNEEAISKMIEYHKRLVLAVGCFLLTVLGLPLAIRSRPGAKTVALPFGLVLFILYYILLTGGKAAAEKNAGIAVSMWTPNLLFGILTVYLLATKDKKSESLLVSCILRPLTHIYNRIKQRKGRL
ncbi:MAG: LptF/LptG family permease [Thermodesulfobacteriota bacterium]